MRSGSGGWIATIATIITFLTTIHGWISPWQQTNSHLSPQRRRRNSNSNANNNNNNNNPKHATTSNNGDDLPTMTMTTTRTITRTTDRKISTEIDDDDNHTLARSFHFPNRRDVLALTAGAAIGSTFGTQTSIAATTAITVRDDTLNEKLLVQQQQYVLKFPTLFDPLYGKSYRKTIQRPIANNNTTIWVLEQNLELGPLQTPIRCTVIQLHDGTLWVHAPLAPTEEFFELVESCGRSGSSSSSSSGEDSDTTTGTVVAHVVAPTYALEHKVFVKDALQRWPTAQLWTSPEQFSFPFPASDELIYGKSVSGVLWDNIYDDDDDDSNSSDYNSGETRSNNMRIPPWKDEIDYASLKAGTFNIGGKLTTLCETAFYHKDSKSLIVTDAVARIPKSVPALNNPEQLLLISKQSTNDPRPDDTPQARRDGWEKTALLVNYFFPEHEELDPKHPGVVTWTEGWHENFNALSGRLIVPPVVRTLIYGQNPDRVQRWVDRIVDDRRGWDFTQIIPAHFEAPIAATPKEFATAFQFLQDDTIDAFPIKDLARGLKPIADIALKR